MNAGKGFIYSNPDQMVFLKKENIVYGKVEQLTYYSQTAQKDMPVNVILPPGYTKKKKYPVLYLLHGYFDNQNGMLSKEIGLVSMLGNLTASGEICEMIVVLPYIFCSKEKEICDSMNLQNSLYYDNFINDLKTDLMLFIEQNFSVAKGRENTAITGFSMGGREALFIGINLSNLFGYVGAACPAPGLTPGKDLSRHPGQLTIEELKYKEEKGMPYLTFLSAGSNDEAVENAPEEYHKLFTNNHVEHVWCVIPGGSHNETSVKPHLYHYLKMIFKDNQSN